MEDFGQKHTFHHLRIRAGEMLPTKRYYEMDKGSKESLFPSFLKKKQSIILTKAAFQIFSREQALGTGSLQRSRDKVAAGLPSSSPGRESLFLICPGLRGARGAREAWPLTCTALPSGLRARAGGLLSAATAARPDSGPKIH